MFRRFLGFFFEGFPLVQKLFVISDVIVIYYIQES